MAIIHKPGLCKEICHGVTTQKKGQQVLGHKESMSSNERVRVRRGKGERGKLKHLRGYGGLSSLLS